MIELLSFVCGDLSLLPRAGEGIKHSFSRYLFAFNTLVAVVTKLAMSVKF
jgi:hypothetical protein